MNEDIENFRKLLNESIKIAWWRGFFSAFVVFGLINILLWFLK